MDVCWQWFPLVIFIIFSQITRTHEVKDIKDKEESPSVIISEADTDGTKPHSRQKRLIWITDDGRLALPPGTSLTISPTIAMPLIRYPPPGFFSNITVSLPLTIDFDRLGLTDNENPLGVLPNIFARSMGRATGMLLSNYISSYMRGRKKRQTDATDDKSSPFRVKMTKTEDGQDEESPPVLPERHKFAFHGGERALLYVAVEDLLSTFGMDGKACMLRAICEVHSRKLHHFGLFGEVLKLFLTASKSPFSDLLEEYVTAERIGEGVLGPGECFPYFKKCPKSLFKSSIDHKYQNYKEETSEENDIHSHDFSQFM